MSATETENPASGTARRERVAARRERLAASGESATGSEKVVPVTQEQMLNTPQPVAQILPGISLSLKALSIRDMKRMTIMVQAAWPVDAQLIALTAPLPNGDFDIDSILTILKQSADRDVSLREVASAIADLGSAFQDEEQAFLPAIADCLLFMADMDQSISSRDAVIEALENCTVKRLVDLLRFVFACVGGFPGDLADRFALL